MGKTTLPRHARTGLLAAGWRKPRPGETGPQPIWPIIGGAEDGGGTPGPGDGTSDAGDGGGDGTQGGGTPPAGDGTEQLGDAGKKALAAMKAERNAAKKEAAALAARLKEFEDQGKSELEKLTERAATAERTAQELARKLMVSEVAQAKGLPAKLAGRLQGSTREELEADADELLAELPPARKPGPGSADQGGRRTPQQTAQQRIDAARKAGGVKGVIGAKLAALTSDQ